MPELRTRLLLTVPLLVAAVLLTACSTDDGTATGSEQSDGPNGSASAFELVGLDPDTSRLAPLDCPATLDGDPDAVCALVTMPSDHARPDGDELQIAVAALPALGDDPGAPLVYLEGGPGFGAIASGEDWTDGSLSELRDGRVVVLVDQRGTGYGEPFLGCPEVEERLDDVADEVDAVEACVERLAEDGVDLANYSSASNAADIAELRTVLGVDEWDVMGSSYGTRLALTLARDRPSGIRALALDGLFPPEADGAGPVGARETGGFALDAFVERCESDQDCRDTVGDPRAAVADAIACAESDGDQIGVDGTLVVNTMVDLLADPSLPELIAVTAQCDAGALEELADTTQENAFARTQDEPVDDARQGDSLAMALAINCAEEQALAPDGAGRVLDWPDQVVGVVDRMGAGDPSCDVVDVPDAPASEAEPVASEIPTLVLNGTLDAVTPPGWARRAADALGDAQLVLVPGLGHDAVTDPCSVSIVAAFLADPTARVDTSCTEELDPAGS